MLKIFVFPLFTSFQLCSFAREVQPDFTAVYNSRKKVVVLRWQHSTPEIKTYTAQRSSDNKIWTDIALQATNPASKNTSFYYEDKHPVSGQNYYRLRCIYNDGRTEYSRHVAVVIGSLNNWVMYPVPVTSLLTLEYRGTEPIQGVINVVIQNLSGSILLKRRYSSQNKQIKIVPDFLPRGVFDVQIIVADKIIWSQQLVK